MRDMSLNMTTCHTEILYDFCTIFILLVLIYKCQPVLSGTKYGLKQTRGKFGLGAKMVCMTCGMHNCICDWTLCVC